MQETLMFDFSQYYSRMARELPDGCRIVEIGVANGDSALYLANELHKLGKIFTLYLVDNLDYGKYFQLCSIYENIIKSGLGEYIKVIPKDSLTACDDFNDGFLDMIFIDSSHTYEQTRKEIPAWFKKVRDGGIVSGHDFNAPEVYKAVIETVPQIFTRTDIPGRLFEPEKVLQHESTTNNFGVWYFKKEWYLKLNDPK